jgi:hypothetical protein
MAICAGCPGGFAARGDPQATMVTAPDLRVLSQGKGGNAN